MCSHLLAGCFYSFLTPLPRCTIYSEVVSIQLLFPIEMISTKIEIRYFKMLIPGENTFSRIIVKVCAHMDGNAAAGLRAEADKEACL